MPSQSIEQPQPQPQHPNHNPMLAVIQLYYQLHPISFKFIASIEQSSTSEPPSQSQDPSNIDFGNTSQSSVEQSENYISDNLTNADHKEKKQESKERMCKI